MYQQTKLADMREVFRQTNKQTDRQTDNQHELVSIQTQADMKRATREMKRATREIVC